MIWIINTIVQKPGSGNKYLFVFINVFNKGDTRIWPPAPGNIQVYFKKKNYSPDPSHYLPDKSSDCKARAIEVKEVHYFPKYFGTEYVEDFGYSHGSQLAYLHLGKRNAVDGYLVYEVPHLFLWKKPVLKSFSTEKLPGYENLVG